MNKLQLQLYLQKVEKELEEKTLEKKKSHVMEELASSVGVEMFNF